MTVGSVLGKIANIIIITLMVIAFVGFWLFVAFVVVGGAVILIIAHPIGVLIGIGIVLWFFLFTMASIMLQTSEFDDWLDKWATGP